MSTAELTARLRLVGESSSAVKAANDAGTAVQGMGAKAAGAKVQLEGAGSGARKFEADARRGEYAAKALALAIGGIGVRALIKDMVDAAQAANGFNIGIGAVAGGASGARAELGFVRQEALRLGLDVRTAAQSFLGLAGATNGTALAGQQTREIWSGVSEAGLALGRSSEEVKRGLEAVSQIASKGVVSMEEIRQQLAESIPGAVNIAARAMNMGTQEFSKLVSQGKLLSTDFLPKFAAQLKTEFGPAIDKYLNSDIGKARVEIAKLHTELFDLQAVGGEAFLGGVIQGLTGLNKNLTQAQTAEQVRILARELGELTGAAAQGLGALAQHGQEVAVVVAALAGLKAGAMFAEWATGALAASAEMGVLEAATLALGGPVALIAGLGVAAITALTLASAQQEQQVRDSAKAQLDHNAAMGEADRLLKEAGVDTAAWGLATANTVNPTDNLTTSTKGLADQTYRLADARRQAAVEALQQNSAELRKELDRADRAMAGADFAQPLLAGAAARTGARNSATLRAPVGEKADGSPLMGSVNAAEYRDRIAGQIAANQKAEIAVTFAPPAPDKTFPAATTTTKTKVNKAANMAQDLAADVVALNAYRDALKLGGEALDAWRIADAGRQAVEKSGLTHKASLTAAESALAAKIRGSAEETERLKLANERVEKAIGLQRTAELDTQALQRRSEAAALGGVALEDLRVKEAGLAAMRQIGIQTLDQLSGADRTEAEAAIAAAEAKERQAIATDKAEKVSATLTDLKGRIDVEKARTLAVTGGVAAEVEYARTQAIRQELDRTGKDLTAEQTLAIIEQTDALFHLAAANDNADFRKQHAEELRLLHMTNQEREIEQRYLEAKKRLQAEGLIQNEQELAARARAVALADQAAAEDARAIGQLKDSLRQAFVDTGKLSFDDVGKYAEQKLREAIYKSFLEKPIDIIINAVVGNTSSLTAAFSKAFSAPGAGGVGGTAGPVSGMSQLVAQVVPMVAAAVAVYQVGSSLSAGLVKALGGDSRQQKNAKNWGGVFGVVGGTIAALVGGKESNHGAIANFEGDSFSLAGDKRNADTSGVATSAANAILAGQQLIRDAGITFTTTIKQIDIGSRDLTHILLSTGEEIRSAVGDPAAAADAALKALFSGATYASSAEKNLVESMLAAGKGFDDIAASLKTYQDAQALPGQVNDAILSLTDNAAFQKKQALDAVEASYKALKTQATQLVAAGMISGDIMAKIEQLHDLQVADVLKRFTGAVTDATTAAKNLADAGALKTSVSDRILQLTNPNGFKLKQINDNIDGQRQQALDLIAAGAMGVDVLGQLEQLRGLEIADAFGQLTQQVDQTAQAFAQAKPQLQQWLDQLSGSVSAELSPAAQKDAALASYKRVLGQAQGGDATALANITGYADRLLQADRGATSSAADRLALYNQVTADVTGLAGRTGGASTSSDPVVTTLMSLGDTLKLIAGTSTQQLEAQTLATAGQVARPVIISNLPDLQISYGQTLGVQTDALVAANDKTRTELSARLVDLTTQTVGAIQALAVAVDQGLAGVSGQVAAVEAAAASQLAAAQDLSTELRVGNVYAQQRASRA